MPFTVKGKWHGQELKMTWDAGELRGDPFAVHLVRQQAILWQRRPVGPGGGPHTVRDHLESELSAFELMRKAFDEILETSGDVPKVPAIPVGAIS